MHDDYWCLRVEVLVEWSISRSATGNGVDFFDYIGAISLGGSPGDTVQWVQLISRSSVIGWSPYSVPTQHSLRMGVPNVSPSRPAHVEMDPILVSCLALDLASDALHVSTSLALHVEMDPVLRLCPWISTRRLGRPLR